jgi:hypothetical protein
MIRPGTLQNTNRVVPKSGRGAVRYAGTPLDTEGRMAALMRTVSLFPSEARVTTDHDLVLEYQIGTDLYGNPVYASVPGTDAPPAW